MQAIIENLDRSRQDCEAHVARLCHWLRQPLQAMGLLQAALAERVQSPEGSELVRKLNQMLDELANALGNISPAGPAEAVPPVGAPAAEPRTIDAQAIDAKPNEGRSVLIVDDDPMVRRTLGVAFRKNGYKASAVSGSREAIERLDRTRRAPEMVVADYHLPGELNGLQTIAEIRKRHGSEIMGVIFSDETPPSLLREISRQGCRFCRKPTDPEQLSAIPETLLPETNRQTGRNGAAKAAEQNQPKRVFIVDDDEDVLLATRTVLEAQDFEVQTFDSGAAFIDAYSPGMEGVLLVDALMPDMDGFQVLTRLPASKRSLRPVMISGAADVSMAVRAMKAGAIDFIQKPVSASILLRRIEDAATVEIDENQASLCGPGKTRFANLTPRQQQIMSLILEGKPSKIIASRLGLSQRTVEHHRATIMRKAGARNLVELIRLALATH